MSEASTIDFNLPQPNTISSLKAQLAVLGLSEGITVLVHSSLSSLGWVCGGSVAVIKALEETIGESGTLVMPTHSNDLSDPTVWRTPPVPQSWWKVIQDNMPAYDPDFTPTREMGIIPETFRKQPGVLRSSHPSNSFAAWGKYKKEITENHLLDFSMNMESPLGRVYELDGYVLLLGVGHDHNTSLHLAEYIADYPGKKEITSYSPVNINNKREWTAYREISFTGDDFITIGKAFEESGLCKIGKIGSGEARFMRQRDLVEFASKWISCNR